VIRKAIKKRKLFQTEDAAKKVIYRAVTEASKKWTMPIRNRRSALNRFTIEFEDRLAGYR
jgi:putative transposase